MDGTIEQAGPAAAVEDDGRRLAAAFDAHHRRLFLLALRLLFDREEAKDALQETFLRAARAGRGLPRPTDEAEAEAWLVRVLVNVCRDRRRRAQVRARFVPDPPPAAPDPAERAAAKQAVAAALARLPARRRAVVVLHELEERDVPEIARLLGLARPTVRWHLAAARRELRRLLAAEEVE